MEHIICDIPHRVLNKIGGNKITEQAVKLAFF